MGSSSQVAPVNKSSDAGSLGRETIPNFIRALREEPVGYQGKLLGREVFSR
jgi:hypothetical protein